MKNILKSISLGLLAFLFFYLAGAFSNYSFDISKWGETSLTVVPMFGLFVFFAITLLSMSYLKDKDDFKKR